MELTEGKRAGCYVDSEANGTRARDLIVIALLQVIIAGQVLGRLIKDAAAAVAAAGNTGDGAMGAITVGAGSKVGDYVLTFLQEATDAGAFIVEDPDGINVGSGDVAAAFAGGGLSFTLADGATDFAPGDQIVITVAAGSGEYVAYDQDGVDGSEIAAGISFDNYDASDVAVNGVAHVRDMEANGNDLTWPSDIDAGEKTAAIAQLKANGVIVLT